MRFFSSRFLYLVVHHDVVLLGVLACWVELGFVDSCGILLEVWVDQVHEGHVVPVVCWVVLLGLSVHVGHVVAWVLEDVIGAVGRGLPSAASLWVVSVGAWGVTGCCGRWQSSETGVDKRSVSKEQENNHIIIVTKHQT